MTLWSVLVLGVLRLGLNCDYDRVKELANEHRTLREMLGHGLFDEEKRYGLQTIKDNVSKVTPEILNLINWVVVQQGHKLLGNESAELLGRCDSYVMETDVDYPTDVKLLTGAIRKVLSACGKADDLFDDISGWRQHAYLCNNIRHLGHLAQKLRGSTSKDPEKVKARRDAIEERYRALLERSRWLLERARTTREQLQGHDTLEAQRLRQEIDQFMPHVERQIDQINRRVLLGEVIPHKEKVFSIFEEHTEWINKGKLGVAVELGLRVCVLEDQMGFILHHAVMQQQTDDKVAVAMIEMGQIYFPQLSGCSFDKGFHSPENQQKLPQLLDHVTLPKKGKWSQADRERESSDDFVAARKQHPAIESAINALEVHGLDRCPDHGIDGFKRYAAWGVLGRNLIKVGSILQKRERERLQKEAERKRRLAA
jgi:IS5 family transposase